MNDDIKAALFVTGMWLLFGWWYWLDTMVGAESSPNELIGIGLGVTISAIVIRLGYRRSESKQECPA